ncbi:MAG: ABC transporter ATP-binding protein [Saprospiraceae bacterium]
MEISIKDLSKKYKGNKYGLKDFNLELKNGILGLLGPNGAGKSTLMRMLATITKPSSGQILLNGTDITKSPNTLRKVLGYLPQDFGVYDNLTAVEFLQYIAALKGYSGKLINTRIEALLEELNLSLVRDQAISSYSGGMRQRVGIAQVLLGEPQLIILDEPTVGLDPEERVRFRNLLADLSGERIIILSSHIVSDIETIANKIAIMYEGQLLTHQTPDAILQAVEDRTYEVQLTNEEFEVFKKQYLVTNTLRRSGGWMVRFVLQRDAPLPTLPATAVLGTLEDAYLRIVAAAKNEN